jgi:hypothetical protein
MGSTRPSHHVEVITLREGKRFYHGEMWISSYLTKRDEATNTTNRRRRQIDYAVAAERLDERVGLLLRMCGFQ